MALSHSIPDPAAIVLKTDKGQILHTGDWKLDETPMVGNKTDIQKLKRIGDEGVIALIGDSTNALINGRTPSESVAREGLTKVIGNSKNCRFKLMKHTGNFLKHKGASLTSNFAIQKVHKK